MTRKRLRPAHSPADLERIYAAPHDHRRFRDHHLRVDMTIEVARWLAEDEGVRSAADLSCGNGMILRNVMAEDRHFGDLAPGYAYTGPIEETVQQIPQVDMFICSETIEHLDNPDKALTAIRPKTRMLILSTPVDAWDDGNAEHYWAWSREDVEEMLLDAGFKVAVYSALDFRPMGCGFYQFGIWGCF